MKFFLFFLILLSLNSCSPSTEQKDQLTLNIFSEPFSLDPRKSTDLNSSNLFRLSYEGLMRYGENGLEKALAQTVKISKDQKTYSFELKTSYWSNGTPLTSYDFARSWKSILTPQFDSGFAYQLYPLLNAQAIKKGEMPISSLGIETPSPHTLIVHLKQPTPYFLQLLATHIYFPIFEKNTKHDYFVSNGAFHIKQWDSHHQIILEKNPFYWAQELVHHSTVKLLMIEDNSTELYMFENQELHWAGTPLSPGLPLDSLEALKKKKGLQHADLAATYYLECNTDVFPLNDPNFRKALAYAINRKDIVKYVTQGNDSPAYSILPPAITEQRNFFKEDQLQLAKQFLQKFLEMHQLSSPPEITFIYNTGELNHKIAQVLQYQWKKNLNLHVNLQQLEWKIYLNKLLHGDFMLARLTWYADFLDPLSFLEIWQSKETGNNHSQWENETYTHLLHLSHRELNPKKRKQLLLQAEKQLIDDMPVIPLFFPNNSYAKPPQLQGEYFTPLGEIDLTRSYFLP